MEGPTVINLEPPHIVGTARTGAVEYVVRGRWSPVPPSVTFQWMLCNAHGGEGVPIEGARGRAFIPSPYQVGLTLRVNETAEGVAAESEPTPIITGVVAPSSTLQPAVPEPVMRWPFRMAPDESHIPFIEQDTPEEHEQCVALVLGSLPGEFPDEPDFGLPDPVFDEGGVSEVDLAAVIRRWEPRAHTSFTLDELIGFAQELGIQINS
jgi:hypothetical protein